MAYHKVILRSVTLQSDLRGVVQAVASLQRVDLKTAVDLVKNLPLTLVDNCAEDQSVKLQQLFTELRSEVILEPPIEKHDLFEESRVPARNLIHKKVPRKFSATLLIILIIVCAALLLVVGGALILTHVKPQALANSGEQLRKMMKTHDGSVEKAYPQVAGDLHRSPRDADLLIQKAVVYLGIARKRMNIEDWSTYGGKGSVPVDGQDLMPIPEADSAMKCLFKARDIAPQNPEIAYWLGELYLEKGLAPEAVAQAQKAVAAQPENPQYLNLLGEVLTENEQIGAAELAFRKAVQKAPDYIQSYRNMGVLLLYHQRDSAQALIWLYRYLTRENLGDQERFTLRKEAVSTAFALYNPSWNKLLPDTLPFSIYESRRVTLYAGASEVPMDKQEALAHLYLTRNMENAALPIYQRLVTNGAASEASWKTYVCLLIRQGQWDAARNILDKSASQSFTDPFFAKNRGILAKYYHLSPEDARDAWQSYLDLGGDGYLTRIQDELTNTPSESR